MFSMCSELTQRARIPDTRIPQLMQPCTQVEHTKRAEFKVDLEQQDLQALCIFGVFSVYSLYSLSILCIL